jgi:hypothetical protein
VGREFFTKGNEVNEDEPAHFWAVFSGAEALAETVKRVSKLGKGNDKKEQQ